MILSSILLKCLLSVILKDMVQTEEKTKKEAGDIAPDIKVEEMALAGLHLGHRTSKVHPKMKEYIYGVRNTVHIIDLEKTKTKLEEALAFVQSVVREQKILVLIGTKVQIKKMVKEVAEEISIPYVSERWLGGTFTNFGVIRRRIEYLYDLEKKRDEGQLEKYTKKERAKIEKEIQDLNIKIGGIKSLEKLPDAIFVLDVKKDGLAAKEARMKGIASIGLIDTNVDPSLVDFPIPANDDAISSVRYILGKVKEAILKARSREVHKEEGKEEKRL